MKKKFEGFPLPLLYAIIALPLGLWVTFISGATARWLAIVGMVLAVSAIAIIGLMGRRDRRSLAVVPLVILTFGGTGLWLSHHRRTELLNHGALARGFVGGLQQGTGEASSTGYTFYTYTVEGKTYTQPLDEGGYRVGDTITIRYATTDPGISEVVP